MQQQLAVHVHLAGIAAVQAVVVAVGPQQIDAVPVQDLVRDPAAARKSHQWYSISLDVYWDRSATCASMRASSLTGPLKVLQ